MNKKGTPLPTKPFDYTLIIFKMKLFPERIHWMSHSAHKLTSKNETRLIMISKKMMSSVLIFRY